MPLMRVETKRKQGETDREMVARLKVETIPEKMRIRDTANSQGFQIDFSGSPSFGEEGDGCVLLWKYKKYPNNT